MSTQSQSGQHHRTLYIEIDKDNEEAEASALSDKAAIELCEKLQKIVALQRSDPADTLALTHLLRKLRRWTHLDIQKELKQMTIS